MGHVTAIRRGDVVLVRLEKTRPCVVVSPDELNMHLRTRIVAPMTTGSHSYAFRVPCRFKGRAGHVVLDQIRTIDQERVVASIGHLPPGVVKKALTTLQEMFAP